MMCKSRNLDFLKIRNLMRDNYERNINIPLPGFTAGPCLLKDTMQLSSFYNHKFLLGKSAMFINENIPKFIVDKLNKEINLKKKIVGVLGLSFKAENDDIRDSLSIKLLNYLSYWNICKKTIKVIKISINVSKNKHEDKHINFF